MKAAMDEFTIHDLERRINERAQAGPEVSYTRKLLDRGVAQCAKVRRGGVRRPRSPRSARIGNA